MDGTVIDCPALVARDPVASEDRMREHIDAYVRYAESKFPEVLDQVIRCDRMMA